MLKLLRLTVVLCVLLMLYAITLKRARAMGLEEFGPAGEQMGRSSDWPKGAEDVLRHPSRVYWYDVNGGETAYYDGGIKTINELLTLYSQIDLAEHRLVIRPGRPSAKSFHGKRTPYVVEFQLPGGIFLFHAQQYASTGLYSVTPQMVVYVDKELAEHLDELRVPDNLTLHKLAVSVEDALAHGTQVESELRYRAIVALGDAADSSAAAIETLKLAAADQNESIRAAGEAALKQVAAAKDPAEQALRKQVAEYIEGHSQRARVPRPKELLAALRHADADFAKGCTARGTRVQPTPSGPGRLVAWTITMGQGRLVVEQRDVEDADHPPAEGRVEYTIYRGPDQMGSIQGDRLWVDEKLIDAKPAASFEPVGSTYNLLIGRALWPLGRGFSPSIDGITKVSASRDGMLTATAESGEGYIRRWELLVDPRADFLICAAKGYSRDESEPSFVVETTGILAGGGRSVTHTARSIDGAAGRPASIAVISVSSTPDVELIRRTEDRLDDLRSSAR